MAESLSDLSIWWSAYKSQVDSALTGYIDSLTDSPPSLREAMAYSLLADGKRLRPILVLLACEACGGTIDSAMPAACAIEMIHTYSLIHDDLPAMDNDDLRRGKPTNHVVYGDAMAILAGDALLTYAFEVIASDVQPAAVAAKCCMALASAAGAVGMVGGQVEDIEAEDQSDYTLEQIEKIHQRKTGRLLESCLILGGSVAQADPDRLQLLENYGKCVGLAFQITDDLLDETGDLKTMGKTVGKDIKQGKRTYPYLMGVRQSRDKAHELISQASRWIAPLGERGRRLDAVAQFVLERNH